MAVVIVRLAAAVCCLLHVVYPRAFRDHFGDELNDACRRRLARARHHGRGRAIALGVWLALDAVLSGLAERARRFMYPAPSSRFTRRTPMSAESTAASLWADLRLASRRLRRAPVFALVTIITLGLGIGASTAIFAVAHAVLLRPLPYADPGRLVAIWSHNTSQGEPRNPVSAANFDAIRRQATSFTGVEAMYSFLTNVQVILGDSKEMLTAATVTGGMFDLIGRPPFHGRGLREGDDTSVVLSHGLWTRSFGGDAAVVGRTLMMPGAPAPLTIVGVMPPDFVFPYKSMLGPSGFTRALSPDLWLYLPTRTGRMVDAAGQPNRAVHFLAVVGRLKPGATVDAARTEVAAIAGRRAVEFPDSNTGWSTTLVPMSEQVVGAVRPTVLLVLGGVAVLLLMTCLNIANVLLARANGRLRDVAVRAALGASAGRLAQASLVESVLLASLGGLAGLLVVFAGTPAIVALAPSDLPRLHETRIDAFVLSVGLALSIATGAVVGLLPALAAVRGRFGALAETHRTTASASRQRVRAGLVVAQLALATSLIIGAGLMLRSFVAVLEVNPGFRAANLLTFQQFVPARANTPAAQVAFLDELMQKLAALPGVVSVGGTTRIPLGSTQVTAQLAVDGRAVPVGALPEVDMRRAVGDYFQAMGMPIVEGRVFESSDRTASSGLAVVNAALAARIFPGERAVGHRVRMGPNPAAPWLTIIGVVGDIRHSSLEDAPRPEIYISYLQGPPVSPFMVVRTNTDPAPLAADVRAVAAGLGADPPFQVNTMDRLRSDSVALRRFTVLLAGLFGVLALVLAAVGIYGVIALVVAERTDEVGVRMALGATPAVILWMMLRQATRLSAAGAGLGLAIGLAVAMVARSVLFGIGPADPVTLIAAPLALMTVALAAAFFPARRATKISPVDAIRR